MIGPDRIEAATIHFRKEKESLFMDDHRAKRV